MKKLPELTDEEVKRFWSKVIILTSKDCWEWAGCLVGFGYGQVTIRRIQYGTHRIAYFLCNKQDPGDQLVCHRCDNPKCCNPNHLWLGTEAENIQDRNTKGRNAKGIKHARAKLTEQQVRQIRNQYATGIGQRALGRKYDVTHATIQGIIHRRTWTHI